MPKLSSGQVSCAAINTPTDMPTTPQSTEASANQRTGQTRLFLPQLAAFTFWGWQAVIVAAAITLPLGYTRSKEYAELEWPIGVLITIVWVAYAIVFFGTIGVRKVRHIYVANWFFGSFIIAVALLHIVNGAVVPVGWWKSYSVYAGVQDAMVQWWYGHNAVGFFLTAGFLGMMYYFIPRKPAVRKKPTALWPYHHCTIASCTPA